MTRSSAAPLTAFQELSYCVYAVPLIATTAALGNFITPYYSEFYGMPLTVIAASLLIIRVIDAILDPIIGLAIDRSPFRQKHRPWLVIALPVYVLAVGMMFFPPDGLVSQPYLIVIGAILYVGFTMGTVVHQAWAAALAPDQRALSRLFGYRELAVIAGILGVFAFAATASQVYGSDIGAQARGAGWFLLGAITLCSAFTWYFTPDPEGDRAANAPATWAELRPFLANRSLALLCLATVCFNFAWMAASTMGFFSAKYLFHSPGNFALGLVTSFFVAPLGMVIWMRLARRVGDKRALMISCWYLAASFLTIPPLSHLGTPGYFTFQALMGLGFGAGPYLLRSLTGQIANAYVERVGKEVRGAAFATTNFFDKLGSGLGGAALIPLAWLGFNPNAQMGEGSLHALTLVVTAAPAIGFILVSLAIRGFAFGEPIPSAAPADAAA